MALLFVVLCFHGFHYVDYYDIVQSGINTVVLFSISYFLFLNIPSRAVQRDFIYLLFVQ